MVEYPEALDSDPDDVSTALTVGASFWARGEHDDAVKWLRKAADEAFDAGFDDRGLELSKLAASLVSVVPPRPSVAPVASVPPPPPVVASVAPSPVAAPAEPPRPSLPVMVRSETATQEFAVAIATEVAAQVPRVTTPPTPAPVAAVVVEAPVERTVVSQPPVQASPLSARPAPAAPPKPSLPRPSVASSATASTRPGARTGRPAGFAVKPGDATRSAVPAATPLKAPTPPPIDEGPSVHERETPVVDLGSAVRTSMGTGADLDATQAEGPRPNFDRALLTPLGGAQRRMTPPRAAEAVTTTANFADDTMSARIADAAVEALVHSAFPDAVPEAAVAPPPPPTVVAEPTPPVAPEVPAAPRVRARLWNATDALRVAVSRDGGRLVLRAYDGVGIRDGEVEAVIIGLSGGPELAELIGDDATPSGDA